jgi:hypothetical protein
VSVALPLAVLLAALSAQQPRDVRPAPTIKLGTAVLEGIVLADEPPGRPLRRATIGILGTDEAQVRLTLTDDAGRFVMPALPAGRYLITASKPPYVDAVYGARLPGRPGTAIVLKDGERRSDLVLKLIRGGVITGVVTDENGRPAVGVGVEIVQPRKRAGDQILTSVASAIAEMLMPRQTTDDRGVYRFAGLPPGDYIVSATPADLAGGDAVVQTGEEVQAAVRDLEAAPKPASKPSPGQPPTSTVIGSDERPQRPVQLSGMPFMNFPAVGPPGMPGGSRGGPTIGYAPVYYPGTTSASDAAPITIGPGDERTNIDILARPVPTTRVDGVVLGPDGQPAPNVSIQVRGEDRLETFSSMVTAMARSVTSRPDGTFSLSGLAPGRHTLQARMRLPAPNPAGPATAAAPSPAQGLWASAEINADGRPIAGLALTLQHGMTISGRVILDGVSKQATIDYSAITVAAQPARAWDLASLSRGAARIDADGTFTITGLVPGTYRMFAQSMAPGQAPAIWTDVSVRLGGREVSDLPFEVRPAENISDALIRMTDRQQQVTGTLQDASGRAATDYTMILFPADRVYWLPDSRRILTARPATDGRFAFRGLQGPPPGDYLLAAVTDVRPGEQFDPDFLAALAREAIRMTVAPGETKTQDVRLVKAP